MAMAALAMPVVVVSGEHDRTPRNCAVLAASVPNGRFHLVEDCGHYVPLEQPSRLAAILRAGAPCADRLS